MLFGKRYRYNPEGLLELAADLASLAPKQQGRAANALRKDRMLRDEIRLVDKALHMADEQIAAGRFAGDAAGLETLRPIAAIVRRLRELSSTSPGQVSAAATQALELFRSEVPHSPPPN